LKNPPILILDEATSALDTKTEKEIQGSLMQVSKGRTTLVIAHRLSTVVNADEIIVLREGKISERGTHKELLQLNGEYRQLWDLQAREMEDKEEGKQEKVTALI
jgi:ABC-type transport system involved in Fe-S cluster assembly fused permease/ATPase subunit